MALWFYLGAVTGFAVAVIVISALHASADAVWSDDPWGSRDRR
jgi:hypothetical protein